MNLTKEHINPFFFLMTVGFLSLFYSCRPAKHIKKGEEHLLNKVSVDINESYDFDIDEFQNYIRQKPNRKIAGITRFHLWVWNSTKVPWIKKPKKNGQERFRQKLNHVIGESPVILDTTLVESSKNQMLIFLENRGYYHSKISHELVESKSNKKKIGVQYLVDLGPAITIKSYNLEIPQQPVRWVIMADTAKSLFKVGDKLDMDVLAAERKRLNKVMKSKGFFHFNEEFIYYKADTTIGNNGVDLILGIQHPPQILGDSITKIRHRKYYIKNISVQRDYSTTSKGKIKKTEVIDGISFISKGESKIHPQIILDNLFIKVGDTYDYNQADLTYASLANLGIFSYINLNFKDYQDSGKYYIDLQIQLSPLVKNSISFQTEGTNTSGNLGVGGNLVYSNKNTFGKAEKFNFTFHAGSEVQSNSFIFDSLERSLNTFEIGPSISLELPHFLLPKKLPFKISKSSFPKTKINLSYNYESRAEYSRSLAQMNFGYNWKESKEKTHTFYLLNIGVSKFNENSPILIYADTSNNQFYQNSFRNYLNAGSKHSFTFTNKNTTRLPSYFFLRSNLEIIGYLPPLFEPLGFVKDVGGHKEFMGIQYAQYTRISADFRYYFHLTSKQDIAFRSDMGFGLPFGNSQSLPFDRSFFAGGSNSIRAWTNRTIGPGSYYQPPDTMLTQLGDIKLELNAEYRFNLSSWIEGALFVDAGNVWLYKKDEDRPGGQFLINQFYKQLATGIGTGLRFDFSFLICRLDWGIPIYNPAILPEGIELTDHSTVDPSFKIKLKRSHLSFGIGYPF